MIKVSLKEYQTILKYIRNKNVDLASYFRANKDVYNEVLSKCFYFKSVVDYYLFKRNQRYLPNEPFIQKILLNCLSIKIRDLKSKGKTAHKMPDLYLLNLCFYVVYHSLKYYFYQKPTIITNFFSYFVGIS